ncbi:hypothetical protein [Micromonospora sp. WMMD812]|uniref:hypothetical protein n=1 Tax=Micromonospora sp. WMMD812 TaxID=3015152 RepID=UPI00248BB250|nr:hypothetical protein [Micromonospora sp. WMMD812]WBB67014.1 hypothetical protein O7603_28500 [Micromonospora sp. WMMD812]
MSIWRQGLWRYRLTTAGAALAALSIATAVRTPPVALSVAAAAAGAVVSTLEILNNRRRARQYRFQHRAADDYRDIAEQVAGAGRLLENAHSLGVVLADESARLRGHRIDVRIEPTDYVLGRDLKRWSFDFLARHARTAALHNDPVLGLSSDLPTGSDDAVVTLRRAHYFDFFCSNLLAPYDVQEAGRRTPVLRGRDLLLDHRGRLRGFRDSRLANVVGVSTLAFTIDGQLLLVAQSRDNVGSPGLVAPSGSGSLEPRDAPAGELTFQQVILNGALREMREECHVEPNEIAGSAVLGSGRWLSRGGVPEFAAVAMLKVTADEVLARSVRWRERPYVGEVTAVRVSPTAEWDAAEPLALLPVTDRHAASWPLAFSLACLTACLADEAWPLCDELAAVVDQ